jgi:hypothetical protein
LHALLYFLTLPKCALFRQMINLDSIMPFMVFLLYLVYFFCLSCMECNNVNNMMFYFIIFKDCFILLLSKIVSFYYYSMFDGVISSNNTWVYMK